MSACAQAESYFSSVRSRQDIEAQTLASLTGGDINAIRARMSLAPRKNRWWDGLWPETKP